MPCVEIRHQFQCIMNASRLVILRLNGRWVYIAIHICMQMGYMNIRLIARENTSCFHPWIVLGYENYMGMIHVYFDAFKSSRDVDYINDMPRLTNGLYIYALFIVYSAKSLMVDINGRTELTYQIEISPWSHEASVFSGHFLWEDT